MHGPRCASKAEFACQACVPHAWHYLRHLQVFMLSSDDEINDDLLHRVIVAGHSRMPVYAQNNKQAGLRRSLWVGWMGQLALCYCLPLPHAVRHARRPVHAVLGSQVCSRASLPGCDAWVCARA